MTTREGWGGRARELLVVRGKLRGIAILLLASMAIAIAWSACGSWRAERAFLDPTAPGMWIVFPWEPRASNHVVLPLVTEFVQDFEVAAVPPTARLDLHVLGRAEIYINTQRFAPPAIAKRVRNPRHPTEQIQVDIASRLVAGSNTIELRVERSRGPAAVAFAIRGTGLDVRSGESARVSLAGSTTVAARDARERPIIDPRLIDSDAYRTLDAVGPHAVTLAIMALAAALLAAAVVRWRAHSTAMLRIGFIAVACAWAVLFFHNHPSLAREVGFDAIHHWEYVTYVSERSALPLANEGYQMYQPPLYYALSSAILTTFGVNPEHADADFVMRIVSLLLGIAQVGLVFAFARTIVPESTAGSIATLSFVGFLPAQLYLFQFVTNEVLTAVVSALALLVTIRMCGGPDPHRRAYVAMGCALGIALLTKVSTLMLVPACFLTLVLHEFRERSHGWREIAIRLALASAAMIVVAGWHYLRVYRAFDDPFVGNWDAISGFGVWQDPGYRVIGDYLKFGRALVEPWYASFHSVPDGIYATLFGDALGGGATNLRAGAPWRYGAMSVHFLLSAVPAALVLLGAGIALRHLWRGLRGSTALLITLPGLLLAGLVYITAVAPTYGAIKAFYLLPAMGCFAALFALGSAAVCERHALLRFTTVAWMLLWSANGLFSFWVNPASPESLFRAGARLYGDRHIAEATDLFRRALEVDPDQHLVRAELCRVLYEQRKIEEARSECEAVLASEPDHTETLLVVGAAHFALGESERALETFTRVTNLAPRDERGFLGQVLVATNRGDSETIASSVREHLRLNPWLVDERVLLVEHLIRLGEQSEATRQLRHLSGIAPRDPRVERLRLRLARAFSYERPAEALEPETETESP